MCIKADGITGFASRSNKWYIEYGTDRRSSVYRADFKLVYRADFKSAYRADFKFTYRADSIFF